MGPGDVFKEVRGRAAELGRHQQARRKRSQQKEEGRAVPCLKITMGTKGLKIAI